MTYLFRKIPAPEVNTCQSSGRKEAIVGLLLLPLLLTYEYVHTVYISKVHVDSPGTALQTHRDMLYHPRLDQSVWN